MSNLTFEQVIEIVKPMSHPANPIGEEIAEMITHMRPDLAEEQTNDLWRKCWNALPETPNWYSTVRNLIATYDRVGEVIL